MEETSLIINSASKLTDRHTRLRNRLAQAMQRNNPQRIPEIFQEIEDLSSTYPTMHVYWTREVVRYLCISLKHYQDFNPNKRISSETWSLLRQKLTELHEDLFIQQHLRKLEQIFQFPEIITISPDITMTEEDREEDIIEDNYLPLLAKTIRTTTDSKTTITMPDCNICTTTLTNSVTTTISTISVSETTPTSVTTKQQFTYQPITFSSASTPADSDNFLFDTHTHIQLILKQSAMTWNKFKSINKHQIPHNYVGCLQIFHQPQDFSLNSSVFRQLEEDRQIYFSFGIHPKLADQCNDQTLNSLRNCLQHQRVRAVGEFGFDFSNNKVPTLECQIRR